jgi:hypothetical protein
VLDNKVNIKIYKPKSVLSPHLWNGAALHDNVKQILKQIYYDFIESIDLEGLGIPLDAVTDVTITGSLANYNWTEFSDVDLHIIFDFNSFQGNVAQIVKEMLSINARSWNKDNNISIKGHDVEMYVQDAAEPHHSSGVYSIISDTWLHKPRFLEIDLDELAVEEKYTCFLQQIEDAQELFDKEDFYEARKYVNKLKDRIKKFRSCGLEKGGEYSTENIVFKMLRNFGGLKQLSDIEKKSYEAIMSIEEQEGGFANNVVFNPADDNYGPNDWFNLRNNLLRDFEGSHISVVHKEDKGLARLYDITANSKEDEYEILDAMCQLAKSNGETIVAFPKPEQKNMFLKQGFMDAGKYMIKRQDKPTFTTS